MEAQHGQKCIEDELWNVCRGDWEADWGKAIWTIQYATRSHFWLEITLSGSDWSPGPKIVMTTKSVRFGHGFINAKNETFYCLLEIITRTSHRDIPPLFTVSTSSVITHIILHFDFKLTPLWLQFGMISWNSGGKSFPISNQWLGLIYVITRLFLKEIPHVPVFVKPNSFSV